MSDQCLPTGSVRYLRFKQPTPFVRRVLTSDHVTFEDMQVRFLHLKNKYSILHVEQSEVDRSRQLNEKLTPCQELPPENRFQKALDLLGAACPKWYLKKEYEPLRRLGHPRNGQKVWSGICYWLSRRMGPIPAALLQRNALDGLSWVLDGGKYKGKLEWYYIDGEVSEPFQKASSLLHRESKIA